MYILLAYSILCYKVESDGTERFWKFLCARKLCPIVFADLALLLPRKFSFSCDLFTRDIFKCISTSRFILPRSYFKQHSLQYTTMIYANTSSYYMDRSKFSVVILPDNYVPIRIGHRLSDVMCERFQRTVRAECKSAKLSQLNHLTW